MVLFSWLHLYLLSSHQYDPFFFPCCPSPHLYYSCFLKLEISFSCVCFFIASNLPYFAFSFLAFGSFHLDEGLCCGLQKIFKHH